MLYLAFIVTVELVLFFIVQAAFIIILHNQREIVRIKRCKEKKKY